MPGMKKPPEVISNLGTHIPAGTYTAYVSQASVYRDPFYKRFTCRLQFDVIDGIDVIGRIPMWLNLGPGDKPKALRRSHYFNEWMRANDGNPPKRADRLPPSVFLKRMTKVEIADSTTEKVPYSVVKKIVNWETGTAHLLISQSFNHSINQSTNQLIKEGIGQSACEEQVTWNACQSQDIAEKEKRTIEDDSALMEDSAPARVENQQPNSVQGREAVKSLPQRHSMPDVNRAERLALL